MTSEAEIFQLGRVGWVIDIALSVRIFEPHRAPHVGAHVMTNDAVRILYFAAYMVGGLVKLANNFPTGALSLAVTTHAASAREAVVMWMALGADCGIIMIMISRVIIPVIVSPCMAYLAHPIVIWRSVDKGINAFIGGECDVLHPASGCLYLRPKHTEIAFLNHVRIMANSACHLYDYELTFIISYGVALIISLPVFMSYRRSSNYMASIAEVIYLGGFGKRRPRFP